MSVGIGERIGAAYPTLTPQEQRAADFILDNLPDLAVYNASELAALSGVSKATISRLVRRLGFENAQGVRDHVRVLRAGGAPMARGRAPGQNAGAGAVRGGTPIDLEIENLTATVARLDLGEPARRLATARRVLVVGLRNSYPVALHLREQLAQCRAEVSVAPQPGQSLGEEIAGLGASDAVVLVGFRRRPESFARLVAALRATGATLVLLADSGARQHAAGTIFLECPLDSGSAFDSYATAMSVVSLLSSAVLAETGRAGRDRVAAIAALYDDIDELERD